MRRRYKFIFILGFVLLAITSALSGWALLQLQREVQLRKQTAQLQLKLDDVLEQLQESDNHYLSYRLTESSADLSRLMKSIQLCKSEIARLKAMPSQTEDVRTAIHHLEVLVLEKFKFSESWVLEQDSEGGTRLHNSVQINDDVLVTDVVQEAMHDIDGFLEANIAQHQGFVDRYFSMVLLALALCALIALALLASFSSLVSAEMARRVRLEKDLRRAQDAALVASSLKSQFLATVSHEIRTPLNGIIGMTDLLCRKVDQPDIKRYAEILRQSGQTLLRLVNEVLDFSKIEAGKLEFEIKDFDLHELIDTTLELFQNRAQEKGILLLATIDREITTKLAGDAHRITQVLQNLVGNAVKFTARGSVQVRVRVIEQSNEQLTVRLSVVDTGPGIPAHQHSLLFQPFNQLNGGAGLHTEGTGLGLSICKQIVERMNGQIGIKSESSGGSEFWFTLPLRRLSQPLETPPPIEGLQKVATHDVWDRYFSEYAKDLRVPFRLIEANTTANLNSEREVLILDTHGAGETVGVLPKDQRILLTSRMSAHHAGEAVPIIRPPLTARRIDQAIANSALRPEGDQSLAPADSIGRSTTDGQPADSKPLFGRALERSDLLILVVEDQATNQILAQAQLEQMGYRVHLVTNGQECLSAIAREHYHLILMDCRMPGMDGLETTRRIRANETRFTSPRIPIVAMTANATDQDKDLCLNAGMDDYLAKPIDYDQLQSVLEKWTYSQQADIDWRVIYALEAKTNRNVMVRLIGSFCQTLETAQHELTSAFTANDPIQMRRIAHQLRPSAAALGARRLADQCQAIEDAVSTNASPNPALRQALLASCQGVWHELKEQKVFAL